MEKNTLRHIVLIPDGNRRWATKKMLKPWEGHASAGKYEILVLLLREARKLGVKYFSIWGFSTENWGRSEIEVKEILRIVSGTVKESLKNVHREKFCFKHIGRKDRLPKELIASLDELEITSRDYTDSYVLLFLDYGGRDEIVRAINKLLKDGKKNVDEKIFSSYLDTADIPDPDLIIRTGGEMRLSGFMPFQSGYAELYFTKKFFPDFKPADLREAIEEFYRRERRLGK